MTRMYIQPSFVDSCSDHGEWSGGNGQYRGDRSVEVVPTYINGKPNVKAFSDEAIEARRPKKTSVPLKDRILPQSRRVQTLTNQMIELCNEYKQGLHTKEDYSLLLSVISSKRARAEQLLAKAVNVKAPFEEEETQPTPSHTFSSNAATQPEFLQEKQGNSVKKACTSAVKDCIILLTGSAMLLMGFKFLF